MATPKKFVTPPDRIERWRKLWAAPKRLSEDETDDAFDEFQECFVRSHMRKMFLKQFGRSRAEYGTRFFLEDVSRYNWKTRLSQILGEGDPVEATVIYGSPDALEAHTLRGERRRSLRDIVIDDWFAACAIVRGPEKTIYLFVQPKMNGCLLRTDESDMVDEEDGPPALIEHDAAP